MIVAPLGRAATAEIRARYGNFALFVGRLWLQEQFLIEAIGALDGGGIVGAGPMENKFRGLARRLSLEDQVHFLGMIDDDQLKHFYAASNCLVLPSFPPRRSVWSSARQWLMGHGYIHRVEAVLYVNEHGVTGFVVPPADSMRLPIKSH